MGSNIFPLLILTLGVCLSGCITTKNSSQTGTSVYFYKPDQEACKLAKSTRDTDANIKCVIGVPFEESDLQQDFEKCKDMHHINGMSYDNFDRNNKRLIRCMSSLGWGLQGATGDTF